MAFLCFLATSQQDNTEVLLGVTHLDSTGRLLTSESEIILVSIADKMRAEPNLMIDVRGYAYNAGSSAANTLLSKKMADQVKAHLTVNLGLSSDRIHTFGYGAKNPILSNKSGEGSKAHHWVDILVRKPDAVLTWFENDVKVQPPSLRPHWLDPIQNYYLYHDYKVATGKKSGAHILYPNNGTLKIGEEATVIIHNPNLQQDENSFIKNLELQDGGLKAILEDAANPDDSILGKQVAMLKLNAQDSRTQIDEKLESLIVAYQSDTGVSAVGEETIMNEHEGAVVPQSADTGPPTGFALGVIIGKPMGISIKKDIRMTHAIDFRIGCFLPEESFHVSCDYLSYFPEWTEKESWYSYLGIGSRLKVEQEDRQFNLGIRVGIGIEYVFRQFGLFGEIYPVVELVPETNLDLEGGFGVRYYINN